MSDQPENTQADEVEGHAKRYATEDPGTPEVEGHRYSGYGHEPAPSPDAEGHVFKLHASEEPGTPETEGHGFRMGAAEEPEDPDVSGHGLPVPDSGDKAVDDERGSRKRMF